MVSVNKVLSLAVKEIGYQEKPGNYNKYGVWYGLNNQPWCYIFISWLLITSGMKIGKCASCPVGYDWYRKNNKLHKIPKPGDLAFYAWNKARTPEHIGIVERVNKDGTFIAIEGNTSSTDAGSQSNGDGVYRKRRKISDVLGFGRPDYTDI